MAGLTRRRYRSRREARRRGRPPETWPRSNRRKSKRGIAIFRVRIDVRLCIIDRYDRARAHHAEWHQISRFRSRRPMIAVGLGAHVLNDALALDIEAIPAVAEIALGECPANREPAEAADLPAVGIRPRDVTDELGARGNNCRRCRRRRCRSRRSRRPSRRCRRCHSGRLLLRLRRRARTCRRR